MLCVKGGSISIAEGIVISSSMISLDMSSGNEIAYSLDSRAEFIHVRWLIVLACLARS